MTASLAGALVGLTGATGLVLIAMSIGTRGRPSLEDRVVPYLRDVPGARPPSGSGPGALAPASIWRSIFGPSIKRSAHAVERVLGGSTSVRLRLARLGSTTTVEQFRVQQVGWGAGGFVLAAAVILLLSVRHPLAPLPGLIACCIAGVLGVLAKDSDLSRLVRQREQRMLEEFPTIADLLALSVAAGEGPVASLERVVSVSHGALSSELRRVLASVRTGTPISRALDDLAARTGLPSVARFAEGVAVAIERGTPLVDVLHAQTADVREAGRRALIESAARKEVAMMLPVVFLILPVTIVFAFYPGLVGLHLTSP